MAKVISISNDRSIFKEDSAVRARQIEYGGLFDELHIVIFTKLSGFLPTKVQIAPNVWVYGTHSPSKLLYINHAVKIASRIITDNKLLPSDTVVTTQDPFETGIVGAKLQKKFRLPLHVQIHTDLMSPFFRSESIKNRLRVSMAKKILPKANAVRVVSKRIADSLSGAGFNLKPGVVPQVLPIYVDIQKIIDAPITVDLKKKYPDFNFVIFMGSRLVKEKNIELAIRIFKKLHEAYSKIGLVIVGKGPEEARLKSLTKQLGMQKSIIFEPWQPDLYSYFKTTNMFLLTSNYEGYGMTLVEAIASHCPTVSTDVGIAQEVLKDGISFVCPVGDAGCLTNNMSKIIENIGLRESFVHEAFDRLDNVVVRDKDEYLTKYKEGIERAFSKNV